MSAGREQRTGPLEVAAALDAGEPVRLVLHAPDAADARVHEIVARAREAGVAVREASDSSLWRLSKREPAAEVLALVGPDPGRSRAEVMADRGAAWLLVGLAYPGNTGFAIRTAEVSGADAVFIDSGFDHEGRREAVRASMRADHFMPVFWAGALDVIAEARAAGRQVFAIEDVGTAAPWEADLTGPSLFLVGGERHGIPPEVLEAVDHVLRLPMHGFIPSYNLQAAMAGVVHERLRQQSASR